jgi:F-type H+-transporting ATPase subunit a
MSAKRRGFILFGIMVVVTAVFCVYLPFFGLPKMGLGVGLPAIALPAEVLVGNVLPSFLGYDLTNSMTSLIVVDIILLLIGFAVYRAVSGQTADRFVPRGLVNFIEVVTEFWYNTAHNVLGEHTKKVVPLALTVFFFVLIANWLKLIPGVETVGIIACAEPGIVGYPLQDNGRLLKVDGGDLKSRAGTKATLDDLHACEAKYNGTNGMPDYRPPLVLAKAARAAAAGGAGAGTTDHATTNDLATPAADGHATPAADDNATPAADDHSTTTTGGTGTDTHAATAGHGNPDLLTVIPYFRPLATDLNMPLALAIIVFIAVQIWGFQALGGAYLYKFINIPALGNLGKKPMGVMDFVVGLVDIVSELSRLISLSFRLLGNLFAGGILLAVMTFLVAFVLPVVFLGLELFVGAIQAYVFAILTVMYASQAVVAHGDHGDEHDSHGDHGHHAEPVETVVDLP